MYFIYTLQIHVHLILLEIRKYIYCKYKQKEIKFLKFMINIVCPRLRFIRKIESQDFQGCF